MAGADRVLRALRGRSADKPSHQPGLAPGTLAPAADAWPTEIAATVYGPQAIRTETGVAVEALPRPTDGEVLWVDVVGNGDAAVLHALGDRLDLHPLTLEDVVDVHQRPKLESFGDDLFVVVRMCHAKAPEGAAVGSEQLCLLIRRGLLITFQERPGDCLDRVRERLQVPTRRIRSRGADYLAYALIDAVIDAYQPVLDGVEDRLEAIEDRVLDEPDADDLRALHQVRRELIGLRRGIAPVREVVNGLMRGTETTAAITAETQVFLRDCYDHVVRTVDQIDSFRELCASLMEMYLSALSNRTNDVMKVLTMIATLFIPLSFMVGLYGMNFDTSSPWNMPELGMRYSYPVLLGAMALVVVGFLFYFKKKDWL